ncbi:alpha/beta hydrolase [Actibacterium sp. 188UL27-1]|uniref:alpha/beta hydrolase n=1 Tax=Actibacterium sp. 188UL27-1 TaxID=2786961 RepID=UPI00351C8374
MTYHFAERRGAPNAPTLFTFHGTGGDKGQFHDLAGQLLPDATVISPREDVSEHGANRFFRRTGAGIYDMENLAQCSRAVVDFITAHRGNGPVLAFGYSNGANMLGSVILQHLDLVDAAALLHPLIPWQPVPHPGLANKLVLITAGRQDPICPAPLTEALEAYFMAQKAHVQTVWHPGGP